ncbi:Phosphoglycolate phosphatase [compost metagenome]
MIGELESNPGLKDLIPKLKEAGYNLTIISSNLEPSIRSFLLHNKIEGFDSVYSARNFFGKHRTIHSFLKKNSIPVNEAIYIGDELRDIEACRKIGIQLISVAWGYDSAKLLEQFNPDYVAYRPEDVVKAIDKLNETGQIQK